MLHPEHVDRPELRDALSTELALSRRLAHPRSVEVHDLLETDDGGLGRITLAEIPRARSALPPKG